MAWTVRQYTSEEVDAAGRLLVDGIQSGEIGEYLHALDVINNWRSSHAFPLNTFQQTLRNKVRRVDAQALVAQRIKRLRSIGEKLQRFQWLRLSEMQDIGGCRVVLPSVEEVDALVHLYEISDLKHTLDDSDDYIRQPKRSGYRGVHRIYRYYSDRKDTYNGLKIEMQFRSTLQHAWATAVETVGTFTSQSLKSSQGEQEWLRFFALMGTAIAFRERTKPVPGTPTNRTELVEELQEHARTLIVRDRLQAYGAALKTLDESVGKKAHYFLLQLDPGAKTVQVRGYNFADLTQASADYLQAERAIEGKEGSEAVLVSVNSLDALRRAYPNYFLDTGIFLEEVSRALAWRPRRRRSPSTAV